MKISGGPLSFDPRHIRPDASICSLGDLAQTLVDANGRMGDYFEGLYSGDPTRCLLLELFVAAEAGMRLKAAASCLRTVPLTTGARWIGLLESMGLIVLSADDRDAEVSLSLSDGARETMTRYLCDLRSRMWPPPPSIRR
ncbi:hypothetical protein [Sphingomonas nostoxanthinifaciens]|uniref:hypothetical protein n=1 Tax=Sphingomonas nostoxanthinifaciens TaxID=2872652 RepID=UPI001CC1ECCA|nr:hypothetical protein [Sphingomonas nostoxanthinifaciens]UAK23755.1 hypothetical protein K8P63_15425 [Sphingomonas nostoxanthinifaciens]